jgi:hypothetical protein
LFVSFFLTSGNRENHQNQFIFAIFNFGFTFWQDFTNIKKKAEPKQFCKESKMKDNYLARTKVSVVNLSSK